MSSARHLEHWIGLQRLIGTVFVGSEEQMASGNFKVVRHQPVRAEPTGAASLCAHTTVLSEIQRSELGTLVLAEPMGCASSVPS